MKFRWFVGGALALLCSVAVSVKVATQSAGAQGFKSSASGYAISPAFNPGYKAPRTPDGQPDFQGVYSYYTYTSTSRPKEYADHEFFTETEAAEIERQATERPCKQAASQLRYVKPPVPFTMEDAIGE